MQFRKIKFLLLLLSICASMYGQYDCNTTMDYGTNSSGQFIEVNEIKLYYETYGDPANQALLIIHGNGGSIRSGRCQIEYFKDNYFVIAVDSRYHGRSDTGSRSLTYELMAQDYEVLLGCLQLNSVYVLGHSDGGIIGLMLAMNNPERIKKLVSIAPNLKPDNTAVHQWDIDRVSKILRQSEQETEDGNSTLENLKTKQRMNLMDKFPNVEMNKLKKIKAPVLVIAADADVIKLEHIVEIFQHIPKSQLFIMPGATHMMIRHEHELLNQMSDRFLSNPFKRPTTKKLLIHDSQ